MKLFRRRARVDIVAPEGVYRARDFSFDALFRESRPGQWLRGKLETFSRSESRFDEDEDGDESDELRPPVEGQEV